MAISVTEFKHDCLKILRRVEQTGRGVTIVRRGKAVARIAPLTTPGAGDKPWRQLQALGGRLHAAPGEPVVADAEFEALR